MKIGSGKIDVKCSILHTMVFEDTLLDTLIENNVPVTVFSHNPKPGTDLVEKIDEVNLNMIYQRKIGNFDYGVFHSKLILHEFDDRLRVVVSSANLYIHDWCHMGQVIWVQDFPKKSMVCLGGSEQTTENNDFGQYLQAFCDVVNPFQNKDTPYRQKIDLLAYNFVGAKAHLVASVNGKHKDDKLHTWG